MYILIPKGFFPVQDTGAIQVITQAPETVSYKEMAARQQAVADEILKDPRLEDRARALSSELRCLVCQNQYISEFSLVFFSSILIVFWSIEVQNIREISDISTAVKIMIVRLPNYIENFLIFFRCFPMQKTFRGSPQYAGVSSKNGRRKR